MLRKCCGGLRGAQRRRLQHGHAECERVLLDRTRAQFSAAACGTVRLGVDGDQLLRRGRNGEQRRHGEVRRAGVDDPHGGDSGAQIAGAPDDEVAGLFWRRSFSSFLRMRVRLSSDR